MAKKYDYGNSVHHHYKLGEIIKTNAGGEFKIVSFKTQRKPCCNNRKHFWTFWEVICLKCGRSFWINDYMLDKKQCFCQTNSTAIFPGYNDITTTDPWMIPYFQGGIEEAQKYGRQSDAKVVFKCPICGKIQKPKSVKNLYRTRGCGCSCSDKVSYPEKFISCLLDQLGIDYMREVSRDTLNFIEKDKKIRYDFYLPKYNCIIETHGLQHYEDTRIFKIGISKQKAIDEDKQNKALEAGIKHYVILDCRESDMLWIQKSVLDSELPALLGFNKKDIDWDRCDEYCTTNLTKEICDYYMRTMASSKEIGEKFHIWHGSSPTHLKKGAKFGWCLYSPKNGMLSSPIKVIKNNEIFYFKGTRNFINSSKKFYGAQISTPKLKEALNDGIEYKETHIHRITDPKEKFIAIYGDEAVRWFEEYPEFNN